MSDSQTVDLLDSDVMQIEKTFLVDGINLPVSVYLRIKQNGYIIIGRKGTPCAIANLQAVKAGAKVFIHRDDYSQMISSGYTMTERIVNADSVSAPVKVKYVQTLVSVVVGDIFKFGVGSGAIEDIKKIGSFIADISSSIEDLDAMFKLLTNVPGDIPRHSMATAMMSLLIAEEMGITQKLTLEKLTLGGLLHDIGLKEMPREILEKPRKLWSEEEVRTYESHPRRGVELLRETTNVPDDVFAIILEHHENAQGTGYPRALRDVKMNPLARIVALADCVADEMYSPVNGVAETDETKSLDHIVNYIENVLGQPFHKPAFLALKNLSHKQYLLNRKKQAG